MKNRLLKQFLLVLSFFAAFGLNPAEAQKRKKSTTQKVQKVQKVKKQSSDAGEYYNGHKIYTGPRGGRYYINKNGNKTYI